jgi:endonuclease-8
MPEGDVLHRIAQRLQPLVGERVVASAPHPRGRATGVAAAIDGRRLEGVEAVGKHLVLRFEGGIQLRSHLRMSGRWRLLSPGEEPRGCPWLVLRTPRGVAAQWNGPVLTVATGGLPRVGPDLLAPGADPRILASRLREADPRTPLAVALQDQHLVAGIGNMWAAEALWQQRLSPHAPVGSAGAEALAALLDWARREMLAAVRGDRAARAVYRRSGRPCPRCGTPIRSQGLGDHNRTAYWCPGCQPDPRRPGGR